MAKQILKDWLTNPCSVSSSYPFKVLKITDKKQVDSPIIEYLQDCLLHSYEEKQDLDFSLDGADSDYIKNYIRELYPNNKTCGGPKMKEIVQSGDFGEVVTKMILKELYNRDCINKLKYKFNSGRSTFGTDLVSFDNINNPSQIFFGEVKYRKKLGKEYIDIGNKKKESFYISVIAHNALKYDTRLVINPVLRFMMLRARTSLNDMSKAVLFREILNGKRKIQKNYEIFLLSEDKKANIKVLSDALNQLQNQLSPLSLTLVLIDDLSTIKEKVWNDFEKYSFKLYGVN